MITLSPLGVLLTWRSTSPRPPKRTSYGTYRRREHFIPFRPIPIFQKKAGGATAAEDSRNAGLDVRLEVLLANRDGHVPHALQRSPPKLPFVRPLQKKKKSNIDIRQWFVEGKGGDKEGARARNTEALDRNRYACLGYSRC